MDREVAELYKGLKNSGRLKKELVYITLKIDSMLDKETDEYRYLKGALQKGLMYVEEDIKMNRDRSVLKVDYSISEEELDKVNLEVYKKFIMELVTERELKSKINGANTVKELGKILGYDYGK